MVNADVNLDVNRQNGGHIAAQQEHLINFLVSFTPYTLSAMTMVPTWWTVYGLWPAWSSGTGILWRLFCCRSMRMDRVNHTALLLCRPVVDAVCMRRLALVTKCSTSSPCLCKESLIKYIWGIHAWRSLFHFFQQHTMFPISCYSFDFDLLMLISTLCLLLCGVTRSLVYYLLFPLSASLPLCFALPRSLFKWRPVVSGGRGPLGTRAVYSQTGSPGYPSCGESAGQEGEDWEAKKQINTNANAHSFNHSLNHMETLTHTQTTYTIAYDPSSGLCFRAPR